MAAVEALHWSARLPPMAGITIGAWHMNAALEKTSSGIGASGYKLQLRFCNRLYFMTSIHPPTCLFIDGCELPGLGGGWRLCCQERLGPSACGGISIQDSSFPSLLSGLEWTLLEGAFGRGGLVQAGSYILRPYRRGGFLRHFNKGTFLSHKRFSDEFEIHSFLRTAGFPTVKPIGYAYRRRFWGFEGVFITRMEESIPWPKTWGDADSPSLVAQVAGLLKALSKHFVLAADLNATNFIVTPSRQVLALDWDGAAYVGNVFDDLVKYADNDKLDTDDPRKKLEQHLKCLHLKRLTRSMIKLSTPQSMIELLNNHLKGDL
jgi:hypothetical protein